MRRTPSAPATASITTTGVCHPTLSKIDANGVAQRDHQVREVAADACW
jgi:hypothetical protein